MTYRVATAILLGTAALASTARAAEAGRGAAYSVVELTFRGPEQAVTDCPARDIQFRARFRHESGSPEYAIHGFHDGGADYKVRFCPTKPGRWDLAEVASNARGLDGQRQGDHVTVVPSKHHGFWEVDADSPGRRWYKRSDGSHQYVFGNTQYSFLSGRTDTGPSGVDIMADMAANARVFKKVRFSVGGDRYPHPSEHPFFDDAGQPTEEGKFSHRPNPKWFRERVDTAVRAAFDHDLVADLILNGPDTDASRSALRSPHAEAYLRYMAARYGSYPNVWVCLSNEYDIKAWTYSDAEAVRIGRAMKAFLPYSTPLSIHASQYPPGGGRGASGRPAWSAGLDVSPPWNDHQIIQRKLRTLAAAADVNQQTWRGEGAEPRAKPTINDELSYQGDGDQHSEADTIESHLGAFLGGGYASTGEKRANKLGQYFWGGFDAKVHTAAESLGWLRERIDRHITFSSMAPDTSVFPGLDAAFRAMAWPGHEYVLGTDKAAKVVAALPTGTWTVRRFDAIARAETTVSTNALGRFEFEAPASRAVLFHFKKNEAASVAGDWPAFRGPTGQGHSAEKGLPLTWDAKTVAWVAPVPGEGWSSPIVWRDHIFVTTTTDGGRTCRVLAFDRRTGAARFDTRVFEQGTPRKERQNSYASPTPCTDGKRVYAVFGAGGVAAVDFAGNVVWTNRDVDHYSRHGLGASPVIVDGLVLMPYDGSRRVDATPGKSAPTEDEKIGWKTPWENALIAALDPETGRRVWTGRRGPSRVGHVTPLTVEVAGERQVISNAGDCIQGFRPADGRRLWSIFAQGEGVVPTPAAGDGLLFTASGFEATTLRAVRLGPNPEVVWSESRGVPTRPSLLYASPYLYAVTEAGIASCWEGATGKLVWRERLPGEYSASPVFADGRIYCLNEAGDTTVIAAGPEFHVLARNPLGAKCQASMAVARGQLFIRTEKQLVAIGTAGDE